MLKDIDSRQGRVEEGPDGFLKGELLHQTVLNWYRQVLISEGVQRSDRASWDRLTKCSARMACGAMEVASTVGHQGLGLDRGQMTLMPVRTLPFLHR